jgi:glycosyltransferase involved in cell wall biosynthesis
VLRRPALGLRSSARRRVTRVHQLLSAAGPYDAVSGQALAWQRVLAGHGLAGDVHAVYVDPRSGVKPIEQLDAGSDDLLVLHYSAYAPRLREFLDGPWRLALVHHNVTPARYLWHHGAFAAVACALGRRELPLYARAADALAGVSAFNARELGPDAEVVPILQDPARLEPRGRAPGGDGPLVLVVGRLVPNKRHDLAFQAFRLLEPGARLLCVGEPLSKEYLALVRSWAGDGITLAGGLPQPDLNSAYEAADVLLSTSEHEGFCVPLLEAFAFGLPVVARRAGGMPEVGGDAVLWIDEPFQPAMAAELMHLAITEAPLREQLAARGRARLEEYSPARVEERIVSFVHRALER